MFPSFKYGSDREGLGADTLLTGSRNQHVTVKVVECIGTKMFVLMERSSTDLMCLKTKDDPLKKVCGTLYLVCVKYGNRIK